MNSMCLILEEKGTSSQIFTANIFTDKHYFYIPSYRQNLLYY